MGRDGARGAALQGSFEELGTPLYEVTFLVVDLETTGLSPGSDRITEIGAVKVRRGEVLGEFHTLVHPGRPVPPAVTAVTGITDHLLASAPPVEAVLPAFLEFAHGTVLVAHNASFDHRFLDAELDRHGYARLAVRVVDTARLARRLLRDEVRDVRLATLARHFRARTLPEHRALTDARATVDVLHGLLERVGTLGATTLEDLEAYTRSTSDRAFRKVSLVADAPRASGVYRFLDERGELLYVGKATDLRARLRTYFGQDRRRRIGDLVRLTDRVEWSTTPTELEAAVRELREIHQVRPRFNRRSKHPGKAVFVKLTAEPFPRLSIVTTRREDGAAYLGPVASRRVAQAIVDAIHEALPLRQCTIRLRLAQDHPACVLKDLGRCGAPCDGTQSRDEYALVAAHVSEARHGPVAALLQPLRRRMLELARDRRFERAGELRQRLHTLSTALATDRRIARLAGTREIVARRPATPDTDEVAVIRWGRLAMTTTVPGDSDDEEVLGLLPPWGTETCGPVGREEVEELMLVQDWLDRPEVRPVRVSGAFASHVAGGRLLATTTAEARQVARRLRRDRQELSSAKVIRQAG